MIKTPLFFPLFVFPSLFQLISMFLSHIWPISFLWRGDQAATGYHSFFFVSYSSPF